MDNFIVYIQEEYGYREWLWIPDMTKEETVSWWRRLPSVDPFFFTGPTTFPGKVHQIYFHDLNQFKFVVEEEGRAAYPTLRENFHLPDDCVRMHIHDDYDSYMIVDGENVDHAGCRDYSKSYDEE